MALHIDNNHILYYHMDVLWSNILGHSYFASHDYLALQRWIKAMFLYPNNTALEEPNIYHYFKFLPGVISYCNSGSTFVLVIKL